MSHNTQKLIQNEVNMGSKLLEENFVYYLVWASHSAMLWPFPWFPWCSRVGGTRWDK